MKPPKINIRSSWYISSTAAILILPLRWILCAIFAAGVHELAHFFVLWFYHVPILQVEISPLGAKIHIPALSPGQEILCAAAGPIASLMLLLLAPIAPMIALFGLVQGIFNLLPIYPMDGGRIFRGILALAKMPRCKYNRVE